MWDMFKVRDTFSDMGRFVIKLYLLKLITATIICIYVYLKKKYINTRTNDFEFKCYYIVVNA